jgi:hypothetical protein
MDRFSIKSINHKIWSRYDLDQIRLVLGYFKVLVYLGSASYTLNPLKVFNIDGNLFPISAICVIILKDFSFRFQKVKFKSNERKYVLID